MQVEKSYQEGRMKEAADTFMKKLIQLNRKSLYRNPFEVIPSPKNKNRMVMVEEVEKIVKDPQEAKRIVNDITKKIEEPLKHGGRVEIEIGGEMIDFLSRS